MDPFSVSSHFGTMAPQPLVCDPKDVSELLFDDRGSRDDDQKTEPYIGPIQVSWMTSSATSKSTDETQQHPKQRGLFTTRDVKAGELLFATPPTVDAPADDVVTLWKKENSSGERSLERIAEEVLVEHMRHALLDDSQKAIGGSFACLTGSSLSQDKTLPSFDTLNGLEHSDEDLPPFSNKDLLQLVRSNAFGPDGLCSYKFMEDTLRRQDTGSSYCPPRLLGMYPLAAMINHSCLANAIRVFNVRGVMVVHASADIPKGKEIVWSYISPTQSLPQRQSILRQQYSFSCLCSRCQEEDVGLYKLDNPQVSATLCQLESAIQQKNSPGSLQLLESLQKTKDVSNTVKRYLRVAYLPTYLQHLNSNSTGNPEMLLLLGMHLHLACLGAHHASTEHFSVVHYCYATASRLHSTATDKSKTLPKLKYWTEQLKQLHMIRFGNMGHNLERVRQVMKLTRELVTSPSASGRGRLLVL